MTIKRIRAIFTEPEAVDGGQSVGFLLGVFYDDEFSFENFTGAITLDRDETGRYTRNTPLNGWLTVDGDDQPEDIGHDALKALLSEAEAWINSKLLRPKLN